MYLIMKPINAFRCDGEGEHSLCQLGYIKQPRAIFPPLCRQQCAARGQVNRRYNRRRVLSRRPSARPLKAGREIVRVTEARGKRCRDRHGGRSMPIGGLREAAGKMRGYMEMASCATLSGRRGARVEANDCCCVARRGEVLYRQQRAAACHLSSACLAGEKRRLFGCSRAAAMKWRRAWPYDMCVDDCTKK